MLASCVLKDGVFRVSLIKSFGWILTSVFRGVSWGLMFIAKYPPYHLKRIIFTIKIFLKVLATALWILGGVNLNSPYRPYPPCPPYRHPYHRSYPPYRPCHRCHYPCRRSYRSRCSCHRPCHCRCSCRH